MGEYERTNKRIVDLKKLKLELFEALEDIRYQIELVESEIADCEGYLLELRSIDGDDEQFYKRK